MRSRTSFAVISITLAAASAAVLWFAGAQPAMAGAPSVDGLWTANYSLSCSGNLEQTGFDVTGSLVCSDDISLDVSGALTDGSVTLVGTFGAVGVTITGELSESGDSILGEWSAPPLVESGDFLAVREGDASTSDVAGFWLIAAQDIFSNSCTVDIDQDGAQLAAALDCEDGPSGDLEGAFDAATGDITMTGGFGTVGTLEVRVNVAGDGESYNGVWRLLPDGPAGIMDGERLLDPTATPEAENDGDATPTPAIQLPDTGGRAPGGSTPWVLPAIVAMLVAGAACALASFRLS